VISDFGYDSGWRVEKHPRFLADLTGDGRADIIGFGDAGVYVALSNGDGTFAFTPVPVIADFGYEAGGCGSRNTTTPRRPHRRRPRRHHRVRRRRRLRGTQQRKRHLLLHPGTRHRRPRLRSRRLASRENTHDSSPTSPATAAPTSSGSATAGVYAALSNGDGTFAFTPVPVNRRFRLRSRRLASRETPTTPRRPHRRRPRRHHRVRRRRGAGQPEQRQRHLPERALFVIPNFGYRDDGPVEQVGPVPCQIPTSHRAGPRAGHSGTVFYVGGDSASRPLEMDGRNGRLAATRPGQRRQQGTPVSSSVRTSRA